MRSPFIKALVFSFCTLGLSAFSGAWPLKVDATIPLYERAEGVTGSLTSVGSNTINGLMLLWTKEFRSIYPNILAECEGKGSGTAPLALTRSQAQLAPMSRIMTTQELQAFKQVRGYLPTRITVAMDALAVYVNRENPLDSLTLPQVDAIFSDTRLGGYRNNLMTWRQVDRHNPYGAYPIAAYGRNAASGSYSYFKQFALFDGDFKSMVKEQPGSASVIMAVTEDIAGIGYSDMGHVSSGVKTVKLAGKKGVDPVDISSETVLDGSYPLGRRLYIYIDKPPGKSMPKAVEEFLRFVLSREGQWTVAKNGYIPLPPYLLEKQLQLVD